MASRQASLDCAIDASVGIKLFLVEPLSGRADALFAHLSDDPPARFWVPDLFYIECTKVLWKYVRRFGYPVTAARQDLVDLTGLPMRIVSTAALAEEALGLAVRHGCSAYDAAYVALAQQLRLPLVTADEALVRRFERTEMDVRFLDDWPI